jgi:hypothetical protein
MANECRIEFYFKKEELLKLLEKHPKAKGVIVSQRILREKPKGAANYVNVVHIRARVDLGKTTKAAALKKDGDDGINGCPFPPGCNDLP